jgi:predicted ATP-grasp superfamily ATP-dependent carboligase
LKILLYEHVSSGGYAQETIPPSLLSEGFAMLRGLTEDFKAAGHEVTVLLDARIATLNPPLFADHIVQIAASGEADPTMEKTAEDVDAAYIIAPEPSQLLQSIVECVEATGTLSLNCQSRAIEQTVNKESLEFRVKSLGLNFPKTATCARNDSPLNVATQIEESLDFPVVVKPSNGAGCCGLSLVKCVEELAPALAKIKRETTEDQVTIQEFVSGVPASVSLIATGTTALSVSLNLQQVMLASPKRVSSYEGGAVPLDHPLREEAFFAAKQLTESFEGLRGYVGVDFILSNDKATVMEVNPRLTTSYVGLRKVACFNVAQAILQSVTKNEIPKKPQINGYAYFSKAPVRSIAPSMWKLLNESTMIASPPFPLTDNGVSYVLFQSYGETFAEASFELGEAKKRFSQINNIEENAW